MCGVYLAESITNVVNNDLSPLSRLRAAKSARFSYKIIIVYIGEHWAQLFCDVLYYVCVSYNLKKLADAPYITRTRELQPK